MKIKQAVRHFGTQREIARILGLTEAAVSKWKVRGTVVPFKPAMRLVRASEGELAIGLKDYE